MQGDQGAGGDAQEDLSPTLGADGERQWLYPDRRVGRYSRLRQKIAGVLILVYLTVPWVSVNSLPLLRLDLLGGRLFFAGTVLRFADISWLAFFMIGMALLLFFVTSIKGRIWCGYACPQTVFVEWLIRPIEELIEGAAHHRRIVDRGPWTRGKFLRKTVKHGIFLVVAVVVANTFLGYFVAPSQVLTWIQASPLENPVAFIAMTGILLAFYFDLGWFREQFCTFLCPYARFQSVLMDKWTPAVAYDGKRGEPRGKKAAGACIDCGLCQRVCPTGIDIRNGLQMECINCNRCADACDAVMTSLKRPTGLIRPASQAELDGELVKIWTRPRTWIYGGFMVAAFGILGMRLWWQDSLFLRFSRQSGTAYSHLEDGRFTNTFNLKSSNERATAHDIRLVAATPGIEVICGSCNVALPGYTTANHLVVVILPRSSLGKTESVRVRHVASGKIFDLPILLPGPGGVP